MKFRAFAFTRRPFVVALLIVLSLSLISCSEEPPLKIGFIGGLTGRVADLGIAGRDGVMMAVEEKNKSGGISGRKVELIVKDDRQNAESAKQAVVEIVDERALAIIGPMTSSMAVVLLPLVNANQIVTVSPTAKTDQLSMQDDFFFRVTTPLSRNAEKMALHAVNNLNLKKFAIGYDISNEAFTGTWLNFFKGALLENGGVITGLEAFSSEPNVSFLPIAENMLKTNPDGILLLSNAIDTALLAQQIRKLGSDVPLFSAEWASTTDLLSFGGRAVDGMSSYHSFVANSDEARYLSFKEKFTSRFGYEPSFATSLAYDAASLLFAGLEASPSRAGLKESLLKLGSVPGLQSEMVLDKYGDVERTLFLTVIKNGQFEVVE